MRIGDCDSETTLTEWDQDPPPWIAQALILVTVRLVEVCNGHNRHIDLLTSNLSLT